MKKDYTITKTIVCGLILGIVLVGLFIFIEKFSHSANTPQEPICPPEISTNFSIDEPKTADEVDPPVNVENLTITNPISHF